MQVLGLDLLVRRYVVVCLHIRACPAQNLRTQRFVLVTQDTTVEQVIIENATGELTVTAADKILALIS